MTLAELFVRIAGDNTDLKKSLDGASGYLNDFGADVMAWGTRLSAGLGLFELAKGAGEAAEALETADATIARATGASGQALDKLTESFRNVYAQSPATAQAITSAMDLIYQRTNTTGTALEGMTTAMLHLAKIGNEDVTGMAKTVEQAFQAWGIQVDAQQTEMGLLGTVSQQTGTSVSSLASELASAAPTLQQFGYNFDQATALIGTFNATTGDVDGVLAGMKKALTTFAKDGVTDTAAAWAEFVSGVENGSIGMDEASKTMGKGWAVTFQAIKAGAFDSVTDMTTRFQTFAAQGQQWPTTMGAAWTLLKHNLDLAIEPIAAPAMAIIANGIGQVTEAVKGIGSALSALQPLAQSFSDFFNGINNAVSNNGKQIGDATGLSNVIPVLNGLSSAMTGDSDNAKIMGTAMDNLQTKLLATETSAKNVVPQIKSMGDTGTTSNLVFVNFAMTLAKFDMSKATAGFHTLVQNLYDFNNASQPWGQKMALMKQAYDDETASLMDGLLPAQLDLIQNMKDADSINLTYSSDVSDANTVLDDYSTHMATINSLITTQATLDNNTATAWDALNYSIQNNVGTTRDWLALEGQALTAQQQSIGLTDDEKQRLDEINTTLDTNGGKIADNATAWDTACTKIKGKLDTDLSNALSNIVTGTGDIGTAFTKLGKDMVDTITNQIIAKGTTVLMGSLGDVLTSLGSIGSKIAGLFGGGSSAAGDAASAAGSAGGDAAGAAGGVSGVTDALGSVAGTVNVITGAVSAVTGVIGDIQNAHQTDILKSIEHNTRYTDMYVGDRADGGILGEMFRLRQEVSYGTTNKAVLAMKETICGAWSGYVLGDLDEIKSTLWSIRDAAKAASPTDTVATDIKTAVATLTRIATDFVNLGIQQANALSGIAGSLSKFDNTQNPNNPGRQPMSIGPQDMIRSLKQWGVAY
jgi:hypothetical protein